jgi:quinohemoprotein ethanol dehydrogenase
MRGPWRRVLSILIGLILLYPGSLAVAQQTAGPTDQQLAQTKMPSNDWITTGGALSNIRYSTLDQINTGNVQNLKGVWLTRLGSGRGSKYKFEADPIVLDGVMYVPTGNDDIFALDAKTGAKLWQFQSDIPQTNALICCGWDNRGVAVGGGKVFSGMLDGSFIALDQQTGKIAWRTQLADYHDGFSLTGAYRYYDGLVFTGISGAENGVRGFVSALDANTGREVWRFYTIPAAGEVGGDTWPAPNDTDPRKAAAWLHGGATVWQAPAIDPDLGMLYFSTGNAGPDDNGSTRPGDNLFSASIVALDYKTGQYKWHFQEVHHDIWDYDAPSPVVLFDQTYNGTPRKGLYECGKSGWCYFLDRTNGQPLIGINETPVAQEPRQATAATQPIPVGDRFVPDCKEPTESFPLAGCIYTPFWDVPVLVPYGSAGGSEWSPTSFDPQTGLVYVMGNGPKVSAASINDNEYTPGKTYTGGSTVTPPGSSIQSTFSAIDTRTNKLVWQKIEDGETSYGVVATAGGLVFRGHVDGNLEAIDATSGNSLWKFQTGWGISAPPMTWSMNGQQYVTVVAGGNRGGLTTLDGDAVWTFGLNGTVDEVTAPPPIQTKASISGTIVKVGDPVGPVTAIGGDRIFDGTLQIGDYYFLPNRVGVSVGTTLNWENDGSVVHTVTASDKSFDSGDVAPGQTVALTFNQAGTFTYNCSPHPWMLGQIIVQ